MALSSAFSGYSHSDPFDSGLLQVSDLHRVYYEQYGKRDGKPVLFLHGGPGGPTSKCSTAFFDPQVYRVVLVDQRGCGKSLPHCELTDNTTQRLIEDIEKLRQHCGGISKWHIVFGGSWGSLLSVAYAQAHPEAVGSLVLRGIFLGERHEVEWTETSGEGAARLYPDAYAEFVDFLPVEERNELPAKAYHRYLTSDDYAAKLAAARAWNKWELTISNLLLREDAYAKLDDEKWCLSHACLENHYFINNCFLEQGQLLKKENVRKIEKIPMSIVQGRYDIVCPPATAWDLHNAVPGSKIYWIRDAGHSATEPSTFKTLVQVCDEYAKLDL